MLKKLKFIILIALGGLFFSACAEEKDESNASIQKRILEAYLEVNYPDKNYTVTSSGLIILDHEQGVGASPELYDGAYVNYSIKNLNGNYQSTNVKEVAEMLGTYSQTSYYGPELLQIGYGNILEGMHEALCMMNKGAKMTVIIPPSLSAKDYPETYGYTIEKTETNSSNYIYEISLKSVITNITKFQIDSLESFKNINYPGLDSTANGFYFKKLSGTETDTIKADARVKVWYVGRLLDGYVFDTNIEDTAKKYGLYDAEKEYTALEATYKESYKDMSSDGKEEEESEGTFVTGFARALKNMTYGDKAVTFFSSDLGYGEKVSGSIPAYSMLFFDMYIEPKADEE